MVSRPCPYASRSNHDDRRRHDTIDHTYRAKGSLNEHISFNDDGNLYAQRSSSSHTVGPGLPGGIGQICRRLGVSGI